MNEEIIKLLEDYRYLLGSQMKSRDVIYTNYATKKGLRITNEILKLRKEDKFNKEFKEKLENCKWEDI